MNKRLNAFFKHPIIKLGFINLFTNMQLTLFASYLPIYLTNDVIVSIVIFTIIISSINFFQIFLRMPMGALSQILGRRPLILFGNLLINVALFLLFMAPNFLLVLIAALLVALGMSCYWPASFSYIQDCDAKNYGKNNGRIFTLGDIGILIGALLAKIFLDQFLVDLRIFFLILAIIGLFATITFLFLLPESLSADHKVQQSISAFINENFVQMISKF